MDDTQECSALEHVGLLIKAYPDFPHPGILFQDIHPVVTNHQARQLVINHLVQRYKDFNLNAIVALESRGYYFGICLAHALALPFVPFRKAGKLPGSCFKISYGLEYGNAAIEVQRDAVRDGWKVVIIDDILATGGTADAACRLAAQINLNVLELHVLVEIVHLKGRDQVEQNNIPLYSLFQK